MKKDHVKREPVMWVCPRCAWRGMKYSAVNQGGKCDICGEYKNHGKYYTVRACNLQ